MRKPIILLLLLLIGCEYLPKPAERGRERPQVDGGIFKSGGDDPGDPFDTTGMINNTNHQYLNGIHFIGQVTASPDPEGDTNHWAIHSQTTPGAYAITHRHGFLHVVDEELAKGRHLVTVKLYDKNDTSVYALKEIPIFGHEDGGGIVGCDTIIEQYDSTWIPGYWQIDTSRFRLVPSCYDTIPIEQL